MKLQYVNKANYDHIGCQHEVNTQPSLTVSGEASTVRQLLQDVAIGKRNIPDKKGIFLDNENLNEIDKFYSQKGLDLTDLAELDSRINEMAVEVEDAQKELIEKQKAQQIKDDEAQNQSSTDDKPETE